MYRTGPTRSQWPEACRGDLLLRSVTHPALLVFRPPPVVPPRRLTKPVSRKTSWMASADPGSFSTVEGAEQAEQAEQLSSPSFAPAVRCTSLALHIVGVLVFVVPQIYLDLARINSLTPSKDS